MKKLLSVLLICALMQSLSVPAFAGSQQPEAVVSAADVISTDPQTGCPYPIIFVTGIGQTWTHLVDKNGNFKTNNIKKDPLNFNWFYEPDEIFDTPDNLIEYNLIYPDSNGLKDPKAAFALFRVVLEIVASWTFNHNFVSQKDLETVFKAVFSRNIMDENGNLPADVEDCYKPYPLSEYSETDYGNFYFSIPCQAIASEIGEDNIYCFYHSAFDYFYRNADDLNTFIKDVVLGDKYNKNHASQVVLIPMSMGAGVVNAYLDKYGSQNDVKKVVSIVGAWQGSDVLADIIEGSFSENAPEMLYYTLIQSMIEDSPIGGLLVSALLRSIPKSALRGIIDNLLGAFVQTMVLKAPSLVSMVPHERYAAIEEKYLSGSEWDKIRTEVHTYQDAQETLIERLTALQAQGMEFYFICGYGLHYGDADFPFMRFFKTADTTNSDEVIAISSTAPGTTFAPVGEKLNATGKYVSPDGSIDLSTSFAPDRTWCFYQQKHQLDFNMTALHLALDISVGKVTDVEQASDRYAQFGCARNIGRISRTVDFFEEYIAQYKDDPAMADNVALAQKGLQLCDDLQMNITNTKEDDDKALSEIYAIKDTLNPPAKESAMDRFEDETNAKLGKGASVFYDFIHRIFGARGFTDIIFG